MGFLLSAVSFLCYFTVIGNAQDSARLYPAAIYKDHLADPYVLSELPLSALLKVKKSVNNIICSGFLRVPQVDETCRAEDLEITSNHNSVKNSTQDPASSRTLTDIKEFFLGSNTPSTNVQDNRKTYYESHSGGGDSGHGVWKGSESSGKIQKLFQFSVTALAFLAFGGYLLCMIVQAIKSKGTLLISFKYIFCSFVVGCVPQCHNNKRRICELNPGILQLTVTIDHHQMYLRNLSVYLTNQFVGLSHRHCLLQSICHDWCECN